MKMSLLRALAALAVGGMVLFRLPRPRQR